jgi:arylsulfatase A-like enzyme
MCLLLVCGLSQALPPGEHAETDRTRPNIILIVADDLGWRDLGSYGSSFYATPRLDEFATSGVRFTHAYSSASTCSPTRASILTGQYPLRIGFTEPTGHREGELKHILRSTGAADAHAVGPSSTNYLAEQYYTLGEVMKDAGYSTAFLGKWHLGHAPHIPENNGFDLVVGGRYNSGPPGEDRRRAYYPPWDGDTFPASTRRLDMHVDEYLAQRAAEFIAAHRDVPFFMCFWPYSVHAPFQSKPELIAKWEQLMSPANPQHNPIMAAMIEVLDTSVGWVLDAVTANGLDENTIIIFTSDNGGNMYDQVHDTTATNNAPLRGGKGSNFDGGVRVPMIVRWPGVTQAGTVSDAAVTSPDHYPTILELAGLPLLPNDHKDGLSYAPALRGESYAHPFIISESGQNAPKTGDVVNTSIRQDNWKLMRYWYGKDPQTDRYALFDIDADIGETNNVAAHYPEITVALSEQLEAYYTRNAILRPSPNRRHDSRSVGPWTPEGTGTASGENGVLVMASNELDFIVTTYTTPAALRSSVFEFEARAQGSSGLRIDWLSNPPASRVPVVTRGPELAISSQWKRYQVSLQHDGPLRGLRIAPAGVGYTVQFRAARVLTPDGTEMMSYEFN